MDENSTRQGRPGPEPLTTERDLYRRLMAQGMGNSQACREIGINRRTGTRWRYGRTVDARDGRAPQHYPPITPPRRAPISARYLSVEERTTIADMRRAGRTMTSIATELGRSPGTISRELGRNGGQRSGEYRPHRAQQLAQARRPRPRPGKLSRDLGLRDFVQKCLEKRWSPEQISHQLPTEFPGELGRHVVHETIYHALYLQGRGGLKRELTKSLRTGRARRKPHRRPDGRRHGGFADSMTMIGDRPAEAVDRVVPGHWEGDLITGEYNGSAIGTLVERTSRFVMLLHLPGAHTADAVRDALILNFQSLPSQIRRSLTWDQGKEMARHLQFTTATDTPVFFCDPHSPWQRGSNENTNGLLRQYFPKSTNLTVHTADDLATAAAELNARPRKTLNWVTPADRLAMLLATTN
jgi:IS30 family transposase